MSGVDCERREGYQGFARESMPQSFVVFPLRGHFCYVREISAGRKVVVKLYVAIFFGTRVILGIPGDTQCGRKSYF